MRPLLLLGVTLAFLVLIDAYEIGLRRLGKKDRDRDDDDDADVDDNDDDDGDFDLGDRRIRRRLFKALMKMKRFACESTDDPAAADGLLYELGEKLMRGCPVPDPFTSDPITYEPVTGDPVTDQPGPATGPPEPDTMPPGPATGPPDTMPPDPATAPPNPTSDVPDPATAPPNPTTGGPDPATGGPDPLERRLALELKRLLDRREHKRRFG